MQQLVFDTSTLQAAWRSGHLETVTRAFVTLVPRAVADETRAFVRGIGAANHDREKRLRLAPDLDAHPRIKCVEVPRGRVDDALRCFVGHARATAIEYKGEMHAWLDRGKTVKRVSRPELEVVALALVCNGIAVLDDHKALSIANANVVRTATTRELLDELAAMDTTFDLAEALKRIEATGYGPTKERSARHGFVRTPSVR